MSHQWKLPDELYASFHRWPSLVALFLVGALIGWMISLVWPSPVQARAHLYVALNPYRTYSDTQFLALVNPEFNNIDNYKNWQMSQLQAVIFLDEFIEATLERLQSQDEYWQNFEAAQLGDMLNTYWRTAGKWTLVARGDDAERIDQAVRVWSEVSVEKVNEAVLAAQETFMIDEQLQDISEAKVQADLRKQNLSAALESMGDWVARAESLPGDSPLEMAERWQVLSLVSSLAEFTPGWQALLDEQPPVEAPRQAYLDWIARTSAYIESEISLLEERAATLERQHETSSERYSAASAQSLGLSPNLEVEKLEYQPAETQRPSRLLILVGGLLGSLLWVYLQLVRITNRETESE